GAAELLQRVRAPVERRVGARPALLGQVLEHRGRLLPLAVVDEVGPALVALLARFRPRARLLRALARPLGVLAQALVALHLALALGPLALGVRLPLVPFHVRRVLGPCVSRGAQRPHQETRTASLVP